LWHSYELLHLFAAKKTRLPTLVSFSVNPSFIKVSVLPCGDVGHHHHHHHQHHHHHPLPTHKSTLVRSTKLERGRGGGGAINGN